MKLGACIGKTLKKYVLRLKSPNNWLCAITCSKGRTTKLLLILSVFLGVGVWLEMQWPFPCFWGFVLCFLLIGVLSFCAIVYFFKKMNSVISAVADQPAAYKANFFYSYYCVDSAIYIVGPLAIAVIFGVGGCSMFGAMLLTPTLIWVLLLFFAVVYISIIGYVQYIALAAYIYNLAHSSGNYKRLSKSVEECVPTQLEWVQNLTKLSHTYRSAFFTLGSTYIVAFGAFCQLPQMQAETSSSAFFILWGIIILVIVLLFPVVSLLEHKWIKAIVEQLKKCYIKDLVSEKALIDKGNSINLAPSFQQLVQTLCATQILNSKDYPLQSAWTAVYALLLSIFNFAAAVGTVFQQFSIFSGVLPQIF